MMAIHYALNEPITPEEFIDVLNRSTLALRRPVEDRDCIEGMLRHANLLVTARSEGQLVGVARSVTDWHYCCYLSDLAVDVACQRQGIGTELIRQTQSKLGKRCMLILLSAPAAMDYYPHIGMEHHPQAWVLKPGAELR
jgi:ribosomal protein S18 acetylase RimI-like enzyme